MDREAGEDLYIFAVTVSDADRLINALAVYAYDNPDRQREVEELLARMRATERLRHFRRVASDDMV